MKGNGDSPSFDDARTLLESGGKHPVFLYIEEKKKGPEWIGWTKVNYAATQREHYQKLLRSHPNTGILLGAPSEDLCTIDCDTDALLDAAAGNYGSIALASVLARCTGS